MPKQFDQPDSPALPGLPAPQPDPLQDVRDAIGKTCPELRRATAAIIVGMEGRLLPGQMESRIDDVLQEACLRAIESATDFDPARRLGSWLMAFVKVVVKEQRGRRARRKHNAPVQLPDLNWSLLEDVLKDQNLLTPDLCLEKKEEIARLRHAVSTLATTHRAVIDARFYKGLEGAELAEHLHASPGLARVRLCRAMTALRESFATLDRQEVAQ